jgi:hypothetical protein
MHGYPAHTSVAGTALRKSSFGLEALCFVVGCFISLGLCLYHFVLGHCESLVEQAGRISAFSL